jgi:hypothetical protein
MADDFELVQDDVRRLVTVEPVGEAVRKADQALKKTLLENRCWRSRRVDMWMRGARTA